MHWANYYNQGMMPWGFLPFAGVGMLTVGILFVALLVWSFVWKGMALWRAAREGSKGWFIALLLINTAGILEIFYLYVFSKKSSSATPEEK